MFKIKYFLMLCFLNLCLKNFVFGMMIDVPTDRQNLVDSAIEFPEKVVVLYSGGLDSSAVTAVCAANGCKEIHLLTFDNGVESNVELANFKIPSFQRRFSETTFIHRILPSKYLFKKVALKDIEIDIPSYGSNLICVGCKMSMHAMALIYAIKNNISMVMDGFAKRQEDFPEQDIAFLEEMKKIYLEYGVNYQSPLYERVQNKNDVKDILSRYNLSTKSIEAECLFGGTFSIATSENIRRYFLDKISIMKTYINECLIEKAML